MKTTKISYLLSIFFLFFLMQSCEDEDDGETPTVPQQVQTNAPPASNYFFGIKSDRSGSNAHHPAWTTDFMNYNVITDQYNFIDFIDIGGNNIALAEFVSNNEYRIHYGTLDNLTNLQTLTTFNRVSDLVILENGEIIVLSIDGNNYRIGGVDRQNNSINFNMLTGGQTIQALHNVGNAAAGTVDGQTGPLLLSTKNGDTLNFNASPFNNPRKYERINNTFWAIGQGEWATATGSDINTASWTATGIQTNQSNTTDSIGGFSSSSNLQIVNGEYRLYGLINTSHWSLPCVNISTDNGQNWETKFLTGLPIFNGGSFSIEVQSSPSLSMMTVFSGSAPLEEGIYSSANGIDFTKWQDADAVANAESFTKVNYKR